MGIAFLHFIFHFHRPQLLQFDCDPLHTLLLHVLVLNLLDHHRRYSEVMSLQEQAQIPKGQEKMMTEFASLIIGEDESDRGLFWVV